MNTLRLFIALLLAAGLAVEPALAKNKKSKNKDKGQPPAKEWYMKTLVTVTQPGVGYWLDDSSGVFGQLKASSNDYDRHDIPVFQSTAARNAALVFYHGEEWGDRSGEYLSDYRSTSGQNESWLFMVNSTQAGAMVTVHWDGLFELTAQSENGSTRYREQKTLSSKTLSKLKLLDMSTWELTDAVDSEGQLQSYSFVMDDSGSRQFMWILGPVNNSHFKANKGAKRYIKARQRQAEDAERRGPRHDDVFGSPPD